ncbi:hypothetical protein Tco_0294378 [Tanacetum coccineum]
MLDKDLYNSWKSRMELYMQNREYRRMILESVEHDLLIWPTVEENGVTRTKKEISFFHLNGVSCDEVKLVKYLHTTNFDQLHAYLEQHELYANEVRLMREQNQDPRLLHERNQDPLAFVANQQMTPPHFNTYQSSYNNPQLQQQFPSSQYGTIHPTQHYSSTTVSIISNESLNLICFINFLSITSIIYTTYDRVTSCGLRFPSTNNQLRTLLNPRNQATIQDGRVIVQQFRIDKGKVSLVLIINSKLLDQGKHSSDNRQRVEMLQTVTVKDILLSMHSA